MEALAYLVDTDHAIDYLAGDERVVEFLLSLLPQGLAISILVLAELYEGVIYSKDPRKSEAGLRDFLSMVKVLGIDEETCKIFAKERGRLRREGALIGDFDLMIAATALRHNLVLVTHNRRHYSRVEGLKIASAKEP